MCPVFFLLFIINIQFVWSSCPIGFTRNPSLPGTCYTVSGFAASYAQANDLCLQVGGQLARVQKPEVLQYVSNLLKLTPRRACWIDALDAHRSVNVHSDECISLDVSGRWLEIECALPMCFVCERPETPDAVREIREDQPTDQQSQPASPDPSPVLLSAPSPSPQPDGSPSINSNVIVQGSGTSIVNPMGSAMPNPQTDQMLNGGNSFAELFGNAFANLMQQGGAGSGQPVPSALASGGSFGGGFGYGGRVNLWIIINNYKDDEGGIQTTIEASETAPPIMPPPTLPPPTVTTPSSSGLDR